MIVFGAREREAVKKTRHDSSDETREVYDVAKAYHDGKWLLLEIDGERTMKDVELLLTEKTQTPRQMINRRLIHNPIGRPRGSTTKSLIRYNPVVTSPPFQGFLNSFLSMLYLESRL